MHELSIAQSIVSQATDVLEREGGRRVKRIALSLGVLSGVEEHALKEAFPIACDGTPLQGAKLEIDIVEASVFCKSCDREVVVTPPFMVCSSCMGSNVEFRAGREMIIRQLEIETNE
jgi:hydrogenase nickel incorporation protein HypA/HybF